MYTKSLGQPDFLFALASDAYAFNSTAPLLQTWSHFPHDSASWLLLAGPGAISRDHVDAAGYCTWVNITAGEGKIWLTCLGPKDPAHDIFNNSSAWVDDVWAHNSSDPVYLIENFYWQSVYLPEGSTMIMQPHTIHLVLTFGPTSCHGGHFYSGSTLTRTMRARRMEHLHLDTLTNETLPISWLLLHCMMLYAYQKIVVDKGTSPYPLQDLASLILMCSRSPSFMSAAEEEPSQHAFHMQKKKADVVATALSETYHLLQEALPSLEGRLNCWDSFIDGHWNEELKCYIPPGKTPQAFLAASSFSTKMELEEDTPLEILGVEEEEDLDSENSYSDEEDSDGSELDLNV
ncbi:hypothetical protein BDV93DRAFT_565786 [Ceratobasidium sp. AG-I]|nr:hypothetical protein BDV93DRAFT_565786 [Ceratobasidium sp. AG-I]